MVLKTIANYIVPREATNSQGATKGKSCGRISKNLTIVRIASKCVFYHVKVKPRMIII